MSVKKCCDTCEFCFPEQGGIKTKSGLICAGRGIRKDNGELTYDSDIAEMETMFPDGCEDWGISFNAFMSEERNK